VSGFEILKVTPPPPGVVKKRYVWDTSGGGDCGPQFFRNFPQFFRNFLNFSAIFRNFWGATAILWKYLKPQFSEGVQNCNMWFKIHNFCFKYPFVIKICEN
jgi:hypothetical protein